MKRNDIKALHTLSLADLQKRLADLIQQVAKARLEKKVGKLANNRLASSLGKDIARVKTIITEKEMGTRV